LKRHLILIGFKSSGKTTVGRLLSQHLSVNFIDTDEALIRTSGCTSVTTLYANLGETLFRRLENELVFELDLSQPTVISTGGGMVLNKDAMNFLSSIGEIFFLNTALEVLVKRLSGLDLHPFKNQNIESVFEERKPLYYQYATMHHAFIDESPHDICAHILQQFEVIDGKQ
jgi:shikimate kinase